MSWTFTSSGAVLGKAGKNAQAIVDAISTSRATLLGWTDEIDATISDTARIDLVSNYGSLDSTGKNILGSIVSAFVAQKIINYDMDSIGSSRKVETMLDVLENDVRRGLTLIKEDNVKKYLGAT